MQFAHVIGQNRIKQLLISSVKAGRIPHAQMFHGPEGCGSLSLAISYAKYIACKEPTDEDSCGKCGSCRKFDLLTHPDLHFSFPVNTSKEVSKDPTSDDYIKKWREFVIQNPYFRSSQWFNQMGIDNKQGLINKRESELTMRKLNLKSFESDYKFLILWLPEKMNATSANMLLKLIEEPPEKTVFLLVSENPENVLLTISSRTQPVKLSRIDDDSLKTGLIHKFHLSDAQAEGISRLSNGNFIAALELMETTDENAYYLERFTTLMRLCYSRKIQEINAWVDETAGIGREKQKSFFTYAMRMIRENFIMNLKDDKLVYLTSEEEKFSAKFHPFINGRNIIPIAAEFNQASADIERNANGKIVLFDMSLKIVKLIKK